METKEPVKPPYRAIFDRITGVSIVSDKTGHLVCWVRTGDFDQDVATAEYLVKIANHAQG